MAPRGAGVLGNGVRWRRRWPGGLARRVVWRTRSSSCSLQKFWHMTESDPFHVFDGSAQNVISISSYIETVGLFPKRPLSKGLYRPSEDDGVLT